MIFNTNIYQSSLYISIFNLYLLHPSMFEG